jgi:hypothetical protein
LGGQVTGLGADSLPGFENALGDIGNDRLNRRESS